MEKIEIRACFEKSGRAVFISHLDLLRTMQRAVKRSGLPVWYTQGFNPRIYLNFPLALSLGVVGKREFMDFAVVEEIDFEKAREVLDKAMPEGLSILSVGKPVHANKEIAFAEYTVKFTGGATGEEMSAALEKMMSMENIEVEKHSKSKGTVKIDIKPHIKITGTEVSENALAVNVRLPAGLSLNINSNVFVDAYSSLSGIAFENIYAERTNILLENGENFV
ncbi:MAG: TIGR03936 family radical SAM-associated protein [Ruminococcus sp.]|nr:TIGR03936 family radical SAM-associated protein [Ruminococcus sp.]MCM1380892.1 TIGR03936 family radical SAM-associated protein [Muribaculaceae bacterium]